MPFTEHIDSGLERWLGAYSVGVRARVQIHNSRINARREMRLPGLSWLARLFELVSSGPKGETLPQ